MNEGELKNALRERGHRVTPQRVLIHRAITELGRHSTAEQVLERVSTHLPNASLPTVYATLELLEDLGAVRRVAAGEGPALWDPRVEPHHHLFCRSCGRVDDLDGELELARLWRSARRTGFRPNAAELVLTGLCARCAR